MTQRDEATLPDQPEKAHGDALSGVVEARPDGSADQRAEDPGADEQD